jgi:hypothetical protein
VELGNRRIPEVTFVEFKKATNWEEWQRCMNGEEGRKTQSFLYVEKTVWRMVLLRVNTQIPFYSLLKVKRLITNTFFYGEFTG